MGTLNASSSYQTVMKKDTNLEVRNNPFHNVHLVLGCSHSAHIEREDIGWKEMCSM